MNTNTQTNTQTKPRLQVSESNDCYVVQRPDHGLYEFAIIHRGQAARKGVMACVLEDLADCDRLGLEYTGNKLRAVFADFSDLL